MIKLIEKYLLEDIAAVRKQFSSIPDEDFDKIIRIDPTFNEERDSVGKYGKWLLKLCLNNTRRYSIIKHADSHRETLAQYDALKNDRRYNIEKDIMRFKSFQGLYDAIDLAEQVELSQRQLVRQAKKDKPYDMVFEGEKYAVFVPKNQMGDVVLASFGGSSKARWCTAADSENGIAMYDKYLKKGGKYYVLINKNDFNDKYQFHFESNQFMDADNASIDLNAFLYENEDISEFFDNEGYSQRERSVNEIIEATELTGYLGGLWKSLRGNRFDIIDNFFSAIKSDKKDNLPKEYYEAFIEMIPQFSESILYTQKKEIMFHILKTHIEDFKWDAQSSVIQALNDLKDDGQKWAIHRVYLQSDYTLNYVGEVDKQTLRTDIEDFIDENEYTQGFCDADIFRNNNCDHLSTYCFDGEPPLTLGVASDFEIYFCTKIFESAYRNLNLYPKTFLQHFFKKNILDQAILNAIAYAKKNNIGVREGVFAGIDGEKMLRENGWTIYTLHATAEEFEEYTGKSLYSMSGSDTFRELLYAMPIEDMKQKVVDHVSNVSMTQIAIKNDGTDFKYGCPYFSDYDIEQKFGVHRQSTNESYHRKIKLKEK